MPAMPDSTHQEQRGRVTPLRFAHREVNGAWSNPAWRFYREFWVWFSYKQLQQEPSPELSLLPVPVSFIPSWLRQPLTLQGSVG